MPRSMILNVGELLSIWTARRWRASVHRVVGRPGSRLSVVSNALRPREDAVIRPMGGARAFSVAEFYEERVALHRPTYQHEGRAEGAAEAVEAY